MARLRRDGDSDRARKHELLGARIDAQIETFGRSRTEQVASSRYGSTEARAPCAAKYEPKFGHFPSAQADGRWQQRKTTSVDMRSEHPAFGDAAVVWCSIQHLRLLGHNGILRL
jgi:hypothetical protein